MAQSIKTAFLLIKLASKKNKRFLRFLIINALVLSLKSLAFLFFIQRLTGFLTSPGPIGSVVFVFTSLAILNFVGAYLKIVLVKAGNEFIYALEEELLDKSLSISYDRLEDPAYYKLLRSAKFSLRNQYAVENLIEAIINFLEGIIRIVITALVLSSLSLGLGLIILALLALNFYGKIYYSKKDDNFYKDLAPINNWIWFYQFLPFNKDRLLDIKANSMEEKIISSYRGQIDSTNNLFKDFYKRIGLSSSLSDFLNTLVFIAVLISGAINLSKGNFEIEAFTMITLGTLKAIEALNSITEATVDFWRYARFSQPIIDFLSLPNGDSKEKDLPKTEKILEARDLDFSYSQNPILENINFKAQGNKLVVIIGKNGSGKSTLVKLISGVYRPSRGGLTYKTIDTCDLSYKHISPIFQDFTLLNDFTSYENIASTRENISKTKVSDSINLLGWKINFDLEKTLGANLSEENVDLSGGQAQQVASLRALYRDRDLIILDEPTSAIDIEKERDFYKTFEKLKKDYMVFLISHRLTAVHWADEIWFVDDKNLEIYPSHEAAMEGSKTYKDLYSAYYENYKSIS
ncbi:MAG: ABC transporter ATP-binding protein [Bacillota bacterium]|nr:ABC transporter ATP-binding protein [Bacillota bacterium]